MGENPFHDDRTAGGGFAPEPWPSTPTALLLGPVRDDDGLLANGLLGSVIVNDGTAPGFEVCGSQISFDYRAAVQ